MHCRNCGVVVEKHTYYVEPLTTPQYSGVFLIKDLCIHCASGDPSEYVVQATEAAKAFHTTFSRIAADINIPWDAITPEARTALVETFQELMAKGVVQ